MAEADLIGDEDFDQAAVEAAEELLPRKNPDLLGHERVEEAALADITAGRLPHALILAGPPGVGKATFGYRLARYLLAENQNARGGLFGDEAPPTSLYLSPDDSVFRRVASGGHADLRVIERAFDEKKGRFKNNIPIDDVRAIVPFLRMRSAEGGWRIAMIDGAEDLRQDAQNALLKILEEPPARALLILTTSQPGRFLPTIRSRCRMLRFESLSENVLMHLLKQHLPNLNAEERQSYARIGDGSVGRAISLYRNGGLDAFRALMTILKGLPQPDRVAVHALAEKLSARGSEIVFETTMELLTWYLARTVRHAARGMAAPEIVSGDAETQKILLANFPGSALLDAAARIEEIYQASLNIGYDRKQAVLTSFTAFGVKQ